MQLYKSLEIILKENSKLKNATVVFFRIQHNSMSSFCRDASKFILNDSPFNFDRYASQLSAESSKL